MDHELATVSNEEEDREDESMEVVADAFALPGDAGFTHDRAGGFQSGEEQGNHDNNVGGNKRTQDGTVGSSGTSSDESDSDSDKDEDDDGMLSLIPKRGRRNWNQASV